MDLTPKQQTSEAIRQAESILILTGQHPSVDQATAVMALTAILRKFGKEATAIISDNPPASVQVLDAGIIERSVGGSRDFVLKLDVSKVELDKLRYEVADSKLNIYLTPFKGSFAPSDVTFGFGDANINYDLVVVLGVPTRARIDRAYEQNAVAFGAIPMVNLDFHRSNENYGAVNLIEPNASSLCEMLVALSESLQSGIIDGEIATALLMGIVASTDRFTAAHTSPKSLTVAAQMMAAGARQQAVVKALYRDGKPEGRGSDQRQGGADRGDRADRSDRGDRGGDRNDRGADRGERSDRGDRSERPNERPNERVNTDRGQAAQPAPRAAQTQPAPASAPTPVSIPAPSQNLEPQTALSGREETYSDSDLPIIQPGHIEMSEPEPAPAPAPEAPAPQSSVQQTPAPQTPEAQPAPGRPDVMPAADFAAAAEMFRVQPAANEQVPERDAS